MNEERRIKIKTLCSRLNRARDLVSSDAEKAAFEATPTGLRSAPPRNSNLAVKLQGAVVDLEQLVECRRSRTRFDGSLALPQRSADIGRSSRSRYG